MESQMYEYFVKHAGHDHGHDDHDHDHDHDHPKGSTLVPKLITMLILGGLSFVCSTFPLVVKLKQKRKTYKTEEEKIRAKNFEDRTVSLLMSFAGGVLFCTIFIHVLPEVEEIFKEHLKTIDIHELEILPQLLMCAGFFMMYIIEEVTHYTMHNCGCGGESHKHNSTPNLQARDDYYRPSSDSKIVQEIVDKLDEKATNLTFDQRQRIIDSVRKAIDVGSVEYKTKEGDQLAVTIPVRESDMNSSNACDSHGQGHHDHSHLPLTGSSAMRSFLFALALSIHELFEGLSIGLQDTTSAVWYMVIGVGAHKLVLAFCMGVEMVAGEVKWSLYIAYSLMFAAVSPIGIACGITLSAGEGITAAVFQGLACGTLVYVLFFEILQRKSHVSGLISCIFVICGFSIMFGLHFIELE